MKDLDKDGSIYTSFVKGGYYKYDINDEVLAIVLNPEYWCTENKFYYNKDNTENINRAAE